MEPRFEVQLKIRRPVHDVFEAVADPTQLSRYFTQESKGRLAEGATVSGRSPRFQGSFR